MPVGRTTKYFVCLRAILVYVQLFTGVFFYSVYKISENETRLFQISSPSNREIFITTYLRNEETFNKTLKEFFTQKITYKSFKKTHSFSEHTV
jgi:uncharacterized protein YpmS